MSKQLFANEKVMTQYLGALLCEDEPEDNLEPVAKLLEHVPSAAQQEQVHLMPKDEVGEVVQQDAQKIGPLITENDDVIVDTAIDASTIQRCNYLKSLNSYFQRKAKKIILKMNFKHCFLKWRD